MRNIEVYSDGKVVTRQLAMSFGKVVKGHEDHFRKDVIVRYRTTDVVGDLLMVLSLLVKSYKLFNESFIDGVDGLFNTHREIERAITKVADRMSKEESDIIDEIKALKTGNDNQMDLDYLALVIHNYLKNGMKTGSDLESILIRTAEANKDTKENNQDMYYIKLFFENPEVEIVISAFELV